MAESVTLVVQRREGRGTRLAQRLRAGGQIPGVLYGHKEETVSVAVSAEDLAQAVRHGARVVDLKTDGGVQKAQISELQWDHLGKDILHVDFRRVSEHERIHLTVPLVLRGTAPGVSGGGVLDQPMHTLHIECPADAVPESIRVNVGELQQGAAIHVRDLTLPEGVKALVDPEAVVVHVTAPHVAVEAPAAPEGTAEPEVIGRQREEGEEEEGK
jgi:large subunit ribosomal protein L25